MGHLSEKQLARLPTEKMGPRSQCVTSGRSPRSFCISVIERRGAQSTCASDLLGHRCKDVVGGVGSDGCREKGKRRSAGHGPPITAWHGPVCLQKIHSCPFSFGGGGGR